MTLDVRGVFRDAWAMWQRDRGVLIAIAGFFLFMPHLAGMLFVPARTATVTIGKGQPPQLDINAQAEAMLRFFTENAPLLLAIDIATVFGALSVLMLYLDRDKRDVGGILLAGLRRLPAYFVLTLIVDTMVGLGLMTFFLLVPALYLAGRLILAGTIFAGEPGVGPFSAVARSFRMTRGNGLVLAGFATLILFAGVLLAYPVVMLGDALDRAPLANPVSALILDAIAAAVVAAAMLGGILVRIALYRRIGASNGI
jgi:hypothetical protein